MATGTIQKNMVLLWENPDASVVFNAQTINLDLSAYSMVLIEFVNDSNTVIYYNVICKIGKIGLLYRVSSSSMSTHKFWIATRQVTVNSGSIVFADAYQASASTAQTKENLANVPTAIYGIKA